MFSLLARLSSSFAAVSRLALSVSLSIFSSSRADWYSLNRRMHSTFSLRSSTPSFRSRLTIAASRLRRSWSSASALSSASDLASNASALLRALSRTSE